VEHIIRIIKIFNLTKDRFRLKKSKYKEVFLTVCGLVRLRIGGLILKVIKSLDLKETIDVLLSHSLDSNFNFEENQTKYSVFRPFEVQLNFIETRFLEETWFLLYLTISENAIYGFWRLAILSLLASKTIAIY
jgi:hypothetical protein